MQGSMLDWLLEKGKTGEIQIKPRVLLVGVYPCQFGNRDKCNLVIWDVIMKENWVRGYGNCVFSATFPESYSEIIFFFFLNSTSLGLISSRSKWESNNCLQINSWKSFNACTSPFHSLLGIWAIINTLKRRRKLWDVLKWLTLGWGRPFCYPLNRSRRCLIIPSSALFAATCLYCASYPLGVRSLSPI